MNNSIKPKIKTLYESFSEKEKLIADYIIKNPKSVCNMSIHTLSKKIGVANSTVFQFTKKLGYAGFKEFKLDMIIQSNLNTNVIIHHNIKKDDNILTMTEKVFNSNIESLKATFSLLSESDLISAVNIIQNANKLYIFGLGASNIVAYDAYHKFLRSPIDVHYGSDYHIQLMNATHMTKNDAAILISHSGQSVETINLAKTVKKNQSKSIVITSQKLSELSKYSDLVLCTVSEETAFHSESMASRISQLSILDSIYFALMFKYQSKYNKTISKIRETLQVSKL